MELLTTLLLLTWYQISFVLLAVILVSIAWNRESIVGVAITTVVTLILLTISGVKLFTIESTMALIASVGISLVIGIVWARFKWGKFVLNIIKENPQTSKKTLLEKVQEAKDIDTIIFWVVLWPLSLLGYLLGDLLTDAAKYLGKWFDRITLSMIDRHIDKVGYEPKEKK